MTDNTTATGSVKRKDFTIPYDPKPIACALITCDSNAFADDKNSLIFAHGAGGTMHADAVSHFRDGLVPHRPCLCFQGSSNLASRVKLFKAVLAHVNKQQHPGQKTLPILGGRSMGARAAVVALTETLAQEENDKQAASTSLVLCSYPLHNSAGDVRDQILLDLPSEVDVLFVSGERDTMCDFEQLAELRGRMAAKSWCVRVRGADHGMTVKPKKATEGVGNMVGKVAAAWLASRETPAEAEQKFEGELWWDEEQEMVRWSDWFAAGEGHRESGSASIDFASAKTIAEVKAPWRKRQKRALDAADGKETMNGDGTVQPVVDDQDAPISRRTRAGGRSKA